MRRTLGIVIPETSLRGGFKVPYAHRPVDEMLDSLDFRQQTLQFFPVRWHWRKGLSVAGVFSGTQMSVFCLFLGRGELQRDEFSPMCVELSLRVKGSCPRFPCLKDFTQLE